MFEDLPVGPQWVLTGDEIRAILADYGLSPIAQDAQTLSGAVNGVVRVASNGGQVIVRVHRPWTTPARLTALHGLFDTLRLANIPLPRILRTRTGATWTQLADRLVEVIAYVPSDLSTDTWAFQAPVFAMLTETDDAFSAQCDKPEYAQAAAARRATRTLLRTLATARARYESLLPRHLIHSDYSSGNVLVRDKQIVALLDFDFLAERERIFDLAYALYWILDRSCPRHDAILPTTTCFARVAVLLRQYQEHTAAPLSAAEIAALPYEMARTPLFQLAEAGYLNADEVPGGAIGQTLRFAHQLPRAEAIAANAAPIGRLFAGAIR